MNPKITQAVKELSDFLKTIRKEQEIDENLGAIKKLSENVRLTQDSNSLFWTLQEISDRALHAAHLVQDINQKTNAPTED